MNKEYYHWLLQCQELTGNAQRRILERFPEPEEILKASGAQLEEILTPKQAGAMREHVNKTGSVLKMQEDYGILERKGISFAAVTDPAYPKKLREIPDPPIGLYYRGKLPPGDVLSVAIVGSRDCSEYGCCVARSLGDYLGRQGVVVISGMARGIDGISQQAALGAGGESYGVLGCGVDVCYPSSNQRLYDELKKRGGILSPYPPGTAPMARNFPPRNRIVSGLVHALVVVEAAKRSGTSITVSMALEQGRDVYVVPGRVTDRLSDGCNQLIKQGAGVFTDPESFLEELQETYFLQRMLPKGPEAEQGDMVRNARDLPEDLLVVWKALDQTPKAVDAIWEATGRHMDQAECGVRLMELVLHGKAKQVSAGHFCRT